MFKKNVVLCVGCLVFLVLLTSASWGCADELFRVAQPYRSGGAFASSLAVGDVNGDGKPDLVVSNGCIDIDNCSAGGNVGVLLGNGDGTFRTVHTYDPGGGGAFGVALADVNSDGKLDLLVATSDGTIRLLLGNGDGTFQPAYAYSSGGQSASAVALADVNGDGKLDLLVANVCSLDPGCHKGSVAVLLGNGDGTFQTATIYDAGGSLPQSLAVADVNGDGKLDLLVANMCPIDNLHCLEGGVVSVLLGNGDGTFQNAKAYKSGGFFASSVAVADVNGDGNPDLLVTNHCSGNKFACSNGGTGNGVVGVLLGNGDGTFQKARVYGSGGIGAGAIAVADVNADGKLDLLVANDCDKHSPCTGFVGVLRGNGDGTFQRVQRYSSGGWDAGPGALAVADVNADGKLDMLVTNRNFYEFLGDGRGANVAGVAVLLARYVTATDLVSSLNPANQGEAVTLTATVRSDGPSAPEGTVTFKNGDKWLGKVTLRDGVAALTKTKLPVGTLSITARYNGDAQSNQSTSSVLYQVVQ